MKEIKNYDDLKKAIQMTRDFKMYYENTWGKKSARYGHKMKRYENDYFNYTFVWKDEIINVYHYFSTDQKYLQYNLNIERNGNKSNITFLNKIYDRINSLAFQREQKINSILQ